MPDAKAQSPRRVRYCALPGAVPELKDAERAGSWTAEAGLYRESRLLKAGIRHGVSSRSLGNMKDPANRARALARAGLEAFPLLLPKQVHGTGIRLAEDARAGEAPEADGWLTRKPGLTMGVFVADCLPIFLWESSGAAAGVFHSGWRGTAAGMPSRAAEAFMNFYGILPQRLCAAIGPHIGACCYKVGPELSGRFRAESFSRRGGALYLDLAADARSQLAETGVPEGSISVCGDCTCCGEFFYSFRRQKEDCRMMAFAAITDDRAWRGNG